MDFDSALAKLLEQHDVDSEKDMPRAIVHFRVALSALTGIAANGRLKGDSSDYDKWSDNVAAEALKIADDFMSLLFDQSETAV